MLKHQNSEKHAVFLRMLELEINQFVYNRNVNYVEQLNPNLLGSLSLFFTEMVEDVNLLINMAERCLEAGADMIMIDADGICKDADSLRADIIAKVIGRLGLEKTMFEASNTKTADWFIKHYGPKVIFLCLSLII